MKKTRIAVATLAGVGALIVASPVADASASTPQIGTHCTRAEASDYRYQRDGTPTVCVYMGASGGYQWTRVARTDPVTRELGQPCSGEYPVAKTRQGKAIMCVQGRWMVGP